MRPLILSLPILAVANLSSAQSMPNSRTMSCAAATSLVRQQGEIVISTAPDIYERYISRPGYCFSEQVATPAWIPTADQSQCLVGYYCRQRVGPIR